MDDWGYGPRLVVLAAAHAEMGGFDSAIKSQETAISKLEDPIVPACQEPDWNSIVKARLP